MSRLIVRALSCIGEKQIKASDGILWIDCIGGLVVGCVVIALRHQVSALDSLPLWVVDTTGIANLLYGGYSFYTTTRHPRPRLMVQLLATANLLWLLICITFVLAFWKDITAIGILHLLGEGFYVASLGYIEWRILDKISVRA